MTEEIIPVVVECDNHYATRACCVLRCGSCYALEEIRMRDEPRACLAMLADITVKATLLGAHQVLPRHILGMVIREWTSRAADHRLLKCLVSDVVVCAVYKTGWAAPRRGVDVLIQRPEPRSCEGRGYLSALIRLITPVACRPILGNPASQLYRH